MKTTVRLFATLLTALALATAPAVAWAGPYGISPGPPREGVKGFNLGYLLAVVLVPDFIGEIDDVEDSENIGALEWQLPLRMAELDLGGYLTIVPTLTHSLQVVVECGAVRGLFGGRVTLFAPPVLDGIVYLGGYGEGGYFVGTDGHAPFAGGGFESAFGGWDVSLRIGYRGLLFDDAPHHQIGLALEVPLPVYALYQDGDSEENLWLDLVYD